MSEEWMKADKPIDDNFLKLSTPENPEIEKVFNVRMQDIDFNDHVNNSVYIAWAVESIPENILKNYKLKHVSVNYINEISYGNKIFAKAQLFGDEENPTFLHSISGGENNTELTRLKTVWEKRES